MPYIKNTSYKNMLFSSETPEGEFYTFSTIPELAVKSEMSKGDNILCRTVGILHSIEGRFFMTDLDTPTITEFKPMIRVTMKYMKSPPQSPVIPYPIQIFGTLQWKNRPVIFAKILQVLNISMAIRVRDTYKTVASIHLAARAASVPKDQESDFEVSISQLNDTFVLDST